MYIGKGCGGVFVLVNLQIAFVKRELEIRDDPTHELAVFN